MTIRKFESCPPRGYVEAPQTWARGPASVVSKPAHPVPGARPPDDPSGLSWNEASTLVDEGTACLWGPGGGTALDYLRGRGLTEATVRAAGLRFTPAVMIPTRAGDRCFRFSGIIIPWRAGPLTRIKIRRIDDGKPKYAGCRAVAGGRSVRLACP